MYFCSDDCEAWFQKSSNVTTHLLFLTRRQRRRSPRHIIPGISPLRAHSVTPAQTASQPSCPTSANALSPAPHNFPTTTPDSARHRPPRPRARRTQNSRSNHAGQNPPNSQSTMAVILSVASPGPPARYADPGRWAKDVVPPAVREAPLVAVGISTVSWDGKCVEAQGSKLTPAITCVDVCGWITRGQGCVGSTRGPESHCTAGQRRGVGRGKMRLKVEAAWR